MAKAQIVIGANGGGGNVSYTPDTSNLLHTISSGGSSWTATEDCIMTGEINKTSSGWCKVYFDDDGNESDAYAVIQTNGVFYIGDSVTPSATKRGLFVKKGTVVSTRSGTSAYTLRFYKVGL